MRKNIKFGLDRLVESGLGINWSKYRHKEYAERTILLKRNFMLTQFASWFLNLKEYFQERDKIEAQLTEEEWLWLIRHTGVVQGKIEYDRRMRLHFPHLTTENILRKLEYKRK